VPTVVFICAAIAAGCLQAPTAAHQKLATLRMKAR